MIFDFTKMKLSGKGKRVNQPFEWLDDNFKLTTNNSIFHEIIIEEEGEEKRFGWISPNSITIQADFTAHTADGMMVRNAW